LEADNLGRVFGIAGRGSALLAVTGAGPRTQPDGLTLDLVERGKVVDTWGKDLKNPHAVVVSREGDTVYVAEIGPNRIRKFEVVAPEDNIFDHEFTA
jgi:peptidylamidoglycolate lyase